MDCPICQHSTSVVEKRDGVRRRRQCEAPACAHRFTTYEILGSELEDLRSAKHQLDQLTKQLTDLLSPRGELADTQPAALDVDLSP